jgi:chemotaxis signal transduction protein
MSSIPPRSLEDAPMTHPRHEDVQSALIRLEKQVLDLQRAVAPRRDPIPSSPFAVLEVPVDGQAYLIDLDAIREVVQAVWWSPLPESPQWVLGTFRYGPLLLPMIDLGMRLTGRPTRVSVDLTLIILRKPRWMGLLTEIPRDVLVIDPEAVEPPTPGISQAALLLGSLPEHAETGAHLLSVERLGREFILGDA